MANSIATVSSELLLHCHRCCFGQYVLQSSKIDRQATAHERSTLCSAQSTTTYTDSRDISQKANNSFNKWDHEDPSSCYTILCCIHYSIILVVPCPSCSAGSQAIGGIGETHMFCLLHFHHSSDKHPGRGYLVRFPHSSTMWVMLESAPWCNHSKVATPPLVVFVLLDVVVHGSTMQRFAPMVTLRVHCHEC